MLERASNRPLPARSLSGRQGVAARSGSAAAVLRLQRSVGNGAVRDLVTAAQSALEGGAMLLGLGEPRIRGSVGRGGKNDVQDVALVRACLSSLGYAPGDGIEQLIAAIERYQAEVVGLLHPDGRVDVAGQTIKALAARRTGATGAQKTGGGAPPDKPGGGPRPAGPAPAGEVHASAGASGPASVGSAISAAAPVTAAPHVRDSGQRPALQDPALEKLVSAVRNPAVDAVACELALLEALFKSLKRSGYGEELGAARDHLVRDIGPLRDMIDKLDHAGLEASAATLLQAQFHHAANAISPYYYQHENIILEYAKNRGGEKADVFNTCNITSLSMALEALGKSAIGYSHPQLIPPIAQVFANDIEFKATGRVGKDLAGLRLPDYVAMCAIARAMRYKPGTHEEIIDATTTAFGNNKGDTDHAIQNIGTLAQLAKDFGASPKIGKFKLDPAAKGDRDADTLSGWGKDHWKQVSAQADRRGKLAELKNQLDRESDPMKQATLEKQIAAVAKDQPAAVANGGIEAQIPLDQYKRIVMSQIGSELDAGRQVIVGQFHHYVRLQSIDDNFVIKDDPGSPNRANMSITWEEARAMGLFWTWLSIR